MSDPITTFFDAWQLDAADARLEKITSAVAPGVQYADPRTPEPISGIDALSEYVGMFSANAPGWSASVVKHDTMAGVVRVTVAFGGDGPDGKPMRQLGQYFIEMSDDRISRMIGFASTGAVD